MHAVVYVLLCVCERTRGKNVSVHACECVCVYLLEELVREPAVLFLFPVCECV